MPKLVDNYVLTRKIGAGQYGEVFRGYDRATGMEIAVKSIKRESVKGKFKELLEGEIRVLKSCECPNIIRLYDMKKTNNNFYLIMEYCNDGDLETYLKRRKYLDEEEAIGILCDIINGFHHLFKHKILHRDLKLANILRHDGVTKIADFGFSKILGEAEKAATILGSPLNMAPEILKNEPYTNKADIYSLGVCYYWILFGRPPFNAKSIPELRQVIREQNLSFPRAVNNVSEMSKQLIRLMLRADPEERIGWQALFEHEINSYSEQKLQKEMQLTLTLEGSLAENVCKLYLSQNLVIIHPCEFKRKEEIVDYAVEVVRSGQGKPKPLELRRNPTEFSGKPGFKREEPRDTNELGDDEDERIIDKIQENTFALLNERNKVVFLLSVMSEVRSYRDRKEQPALLHQLLVLCRALWSRLEKAIRQKSNEFALPYWLEFLGSSSFHNLEHFLAKEEAIVKFELENSQRVAQNTSEPLRTLVKAYGARICELLKKNELDEAHRLQWIHLSHLVDILDIEHLMTKDFDFKHYYCDFGKFEMKELVETVRARLKAL